MLRLCAKEMSNTRAKQMSAKEMSSLYINSLTPPPTPRPTPGPRPVTARARPCLPPTTVRKLGGGGAAPCPHPATSREPGGQPACRSISTMRIMNFAGSIVFPKILGPGIVSVDFGGGPRGNKSTRILRFSLGKTSLLGKGYFSRASDGVRRSPFQIFPPSLPSN